MEAVEASVITPSNNRRRSIRSGPCFYRNWKIVIPDSDGGKLHLLDVETRGGDGGDDGVVDPVEVSEGA